jgi:hypothetical protein
MSEVQLDQVEFEELLDLDSLQRPHTDQEHRRALDLFSRLSPGQLVGYYRMLEFQCCETWLQYPTYDQPTRCPECGSTFTLVL